MKRISVVAVLVVLFALRCASTLRDNAGPSALDAAWMKAFKAGDLEGVMSCYAPDAVDWEPGAPEAKGEAAIRQGYRDFFAANTVLDIKDFGNQYPIVGYFAVAWGKSAKRYIPKAHRKPVTSTGRFFFAAEKRNGKWLCVVDHGSDDRVPSRGAIHRCG